MKNVVISIGNSDNRLTQQEWFHYVDEVSWLISKSKAHVHFFGASENYKPWQNVAWWIEINDFELLHLKIHLKNVREYYKQDSVAMLEGETEFI